MDIKVAATKTKELVNAVAHEAHVDSLAFCADHSNVGYRHTMMLLDAIESGTNVSGEKAHRWLGWAQCAIVAARIGTLDEMKQINHKA